MTWEETIEFIRTKPEYISLVKDSYLLPDLETNVYNYKNSEEFISILNKIRILPGNIYKILDIGSGNGITSISFALEGFHVTTIEPNPSNTVGCGAIKFLKEKFQLSNVEIIQGYCEDITLTDNTFDLVFARQCMHHANNLNKFVSEMSRVLKVGGYFFTVRDHVCFNNDDKEKFLKSHPLQEFYGGENAFTSFEYRNAISQANLKLLEEIRYYDSVINYFPKTNFEIKNLHRDRIQKLKNYFKIKYRFPIISDLAVILFLLKNYVNSLDTYNEIKIPGRMYSYLAKK